MKLECTACGLRLNHLHFKRDDELNMKLFSVCDICQLRGVDPLKYENKVVQKLSEICMFNFCGKVTKAIVATKYTTFVIPKYKRAYEAFIQDYDCNDVAIDQINRNTFYQFVIKSEKGELPSPELTNTFEENLLQLGIKADFSFNKIDYIDREYIRNKYKYRCQYCGRRGTSVDHKDPVCFSHDNGLDNLILSCSECNKIKGNMSYQSFCKMNAKIKNINKKLVKYETYLNCLHELFDENKRYIDGQVHLRGVIRDTEIDAMRKQNKSLHDAIDSLQSDYDKLRLIRKNYFEVNDNITNAEKTNKLF